MLFVYPMESFVARHALVVLLFEGREAKEGDHSSILNRRDRRIALTVALYLVAAMPAMVFTSLGSVLAITGAIAGSCLSYIGPGIIYIGIHGEEFLELTESSFFYFGRGKVVSSANKGDEEETTALLDCDTVINNHSNKAGSAFTEDDSSCLACWFCKCILWYLLGMPIWTSLATAGKRGLKKHATEMAIKSPHPIRIGSVRYSRKSAIGIAYAASLAIREDKPLMFDYWTLSTEGKIIVGVRSENSEKLLIKNEEEYTSPIKQIYRAGSELVVITENSIYLIVNPIYLIVWRWQFLKQKLQ